MAPSLDPVVYRGETAKRNKIVATLLTALHPTLGYLYVGRTKSAAVSAAFFTTYLTAFIAVWISLQFFPILPLVALAFGWFVMVGACLAGVLRHATAEGEDYLLKGINHPVVYAVAFVLIGIIPAYSHYFCATHLLWGVVNINDNSMYPTLVPGDTLLIDRLAFERKTPVRGAKVVVRTGVDEMNHVTLSRVLALPGDSVRLKDGVCFS